jgi:hypothetical protein
MRHGGCRSWLESDACEDAIWKDGGGVVQGVECKVSCRQWERDARAGQVAVRRSSRLGAGVGQKKEDIAEG